MTRINAGIPVKSLSHKHLLAEHREIKRVCKLLNDRIAKNNFDGIPGNFHEMVGDRIVFRTLFWLDKGEYTLTRYYQILQECRDRKFKVIDFSRNWSVYDRKPEFFKDYVPTSNQIEMIQQRINERTKTFAVVKI